MKPNQSQMSQSLMSSPVIQKISKRMNVMPMEVKELIALLKGSYDHCDWILKMFCKRAKIDQRFAEMIRAILKLFSNES